MHFDIVETSRICSVLVTFDNKSVKYEDKVEATKVSMLDVLY